MVGLAVAGLALVAAVVVVVTGGSLVASVLVIAGLLLSLAAARATLAVHVALPRAPRPHQPVIFYNTRSGGGKAERFAVAKEARARGIEPIELKPGDDLETLVRGAVDRGADALAMAGGDGSQAIVAAMAAERGLPYACIPAGTRNHFALDLGVDRDDVVGALDAFVDGGERTWTWPRSTGACSSTTSRSGSMPRRSSTRAIATRSCARCSTPCRTCSGPRVKASTCAGPGRTGTRVVPER